MLVKLTFHTTRPVINRASTICSAFLVLLELAQDGEKQLHTISSYFPKAITTGISHRTSIDIVSSVLVKPVLAQLSLFWSLVLLRFEGETYIFLADVIVKTWNPEDVGPTTTRLEGCFQRLFTTDTNDSKLQGCLGSPPDFKAPATRGSHSAPYTPDTV